MSDDSDMSPGRRRKRKIHYIEDSSSSSSDEFIVHRRRRPLILQELNTDSDSSSESDSSSSDIIPNKKRIPKVVSSGETDLDMSSDSETDSSLKNDLHTKRENDMEESGNSSDTSDGQSEKCPICLATFKNQEVGLPQACDHSFCAECIQEWSKNVNTCPVDRQPFNLIYIKEHYNGEIIRQIPVDTFQEPSEEVDNPTFCEVCRQSDREDRMLLCDDCDLGYHLECLDPPLTEIPPGIWYCPVCEPVIQTMNPLVDIYDVRLLVEDAEVLGWTHLQNMASRMVPRTLHSERVRARIITQRHRVVENQSSFNSNVAGPSTSYANTASVTTKRKRKKRKYKSSRKRRLGSNKKDKLLLKAKLLYKKERTKKRKNRKLKQLNSVKERLAFKLQICPPKRSGQMLPDVRIQTNNDTISYQRSQASIPVLDLFGQNEQLEVYSDDEETESAGINVLRARRPNFSDVLAFRRAARRKTLVTGDMIQPPQTSSTDILGSIMDSQEKFHSKNYFLSLNNDGSVSITKKKKTINLNDCTNNVKQAPMHSEKTSSSGSPKKNAQGPDFVANTNAENQNVVTTSSSSNFNIFENESDRNQSFKDTDNFTTDADKEPKKVKNNRRDSSSDSSPNHTDSDVDIYSDIEVTTSRTAEPQASTPPLTQQMNDLSEDEANSDVDLVIDTEKTEATTTEEVSSTINSTLPVNSNIQEVHSTSDVVQENEESKHYTKDEDEDSQDGCPNFSIYSSASIYMAKTTDINLPNEMENNSEKEVKKDEPETKPFACITDISTMTEDISEEERSYTPCLDEKEERTKEGLDGLDTEMISDEEKNDFDESHELKTVSDGDALEINAKESELDFSKPEDYEEGEIVDKFKKFEEKKQSIEKHKPKDVPSEIKKQIEDLTKEETKSKEKENKPPQQSDGTNKEASFKKLSKNNKERNYRENKSKERSKSKERNHDRETRRDKRKEKHKEIVRYSVRSMIAEKPRKDKFGRDEVRKRSMSRSSRSVTPRRSPSRRSLSRDRARRGRGRSRGRRSVSRSLTRSRSYEYRRSRSRNRKKKLRSPSRDNKHKSRRKSRDKSKNKNKKNKSRSRQRSRTPSPRRKRDWERKHSRGWSPSPSRSYTPELRHLTPSWTPPRILDKQPVKPHNLTVILTNDASKKKKEKKKKSDKKQKDTGVEKQKKKKRDRTPPPSKEVFASGDNILVSVSFNKDNEDSNKRKRESDELTTKRSRKEKDKRNNREKSPKLRRKRNKELIASLKPVAIIDLDRSPFKEITPSPKDIIVLSDSDNGGDSNEHMIQTAICDSSQTEHSTGNNNYSTGPKTPPEPQIKFSLNAKQPPLRAISNPLHEPDDGDVEVDAQEMLDERLNDVHHIGPNTPPEPPNSPPSSPDAYDPFDPTKSRSPTPQPQNIPAIAIQTNDSGSTLENRGDTIMDNMLDGTDILKSHSPGGSTTATDIQAADSQSSIRAVSSPTDRKSPECSIGVVINQIVQSQASVFPVNVSTSSLVTTPQVNTPRVTILNSTVLPSSVVSSVPQRIVLPNTTTKPSPVKVSPTKPPIKSTPIKPMPVVKNIIKTARKMNNRNQNGGELNEVIDFDSPYSPGSSDYEDLFEPPVEISKPCKQAPPVQVQKTPKPAMKIQSTFDALFGSTSPTYGGMKKKPPAKSTSKKPPHMNKGSSKQIGVKLDEDNLKILDDLPNSAVEMQVKDKFLKKLNRQERVVEEVKLVLKPHYNKKRINKEEYKDILRRAVPKICHSKSGEINPKKIQNLIEAYVKKLRHSKKVTSSSCINPQKS